MKHTNLPALVYRGRRTKASRVVTTTFASGRGVERKAMAAYLTEQGVGQVKVVKAHRDSNQEMRLKREAPWMFRFGDRESNLGGSNRRA